MRYAVVVILVALALPLGQPAGAETFAGRSYEITDGRPSSTRAAPLVLALHGGFGTSRAMREKTGFDTLARREGFVVVYPNGNRRRWNDGRGHSEAEDVRYLSALIAKLVRDGVADPERVFITGHSNGGGMAMRMACDRPDLVAGISVVATKVLTAYPCRNGKAVPAIFFHGTLDPLAPHAGRPDNARLGGTYSSAESLAIWSDRNGCRSPGKTRFADRVDDGTSVSITPYRGCRAALTHVVIEGHGHSWPGAGERLRRLQGPASREISATAATMQFFNRL